MVDWSPTVEGIAEECWNQLQSCIISSAEELIGRGTAPTLEDNVDVLKSLIDTKNEALQKLVQRATVPGPFFHQYQQAVQKAVNKPK